MSPRPLFAFAIGCLTVSIAHSAENFGPALVFLGVAVGFWGLFEFIGRIGS